MPRLSLRRRRRGELTVRDLTAAEMDRRLPHALAIYVAAMGYPSTYADARLELARDQIRLPGAQSVGAFDRGRLVGFGYGYGSEPGQWWHDEVARGLGTLVDGDAWIEDAWELCELHVAPTHQGRGSGRRMLDSLLQRADRRTVLLSTPAPVSGSTAAVALYRSAGFVHLINDYRFPGDARSFTIMGQRRDRRDDR